MIFVTVGTHEQQFNRLIEFIDRMKGQGLIEEEVIMQTGYSTYEPSFCKWDRMLPYSQMEKNVQDARIVSTHGGPASFIMPLRLGKVPIVVPRQYSLREHVNNHQVDFVKKVSEEKGMIIPVFDIQDLEHIVLDYDNIVKNKNSNLVSNNARFNEEFAKIVDSLFEGK